MNKWQLAEMMGATIVIDPPSRNQYDVTVKFGKCEKHFASRYHADDFYEYAAELVFQMIRDAVYFANKIDWSEK